jgi:hypothetical protein
VCVFILGFFFWFFTSILRFFFCLSLVMNLLFQT